ncbi:MAG: S8 family serine peptidase [Neptuniibacter sp.]
MSFRFKKNKVPAFIIGSLLASVAFSVQAEPPFKKGQIVVSGDVWEFSDYEVIKHLPHSGLTVLKVAPGKERGQVNALRNKGRKASLNYIVTKFAPNDTYYTYQWHLPKIETEQAWATTKGKVVTGEGVTGEGVTVAVLDTGFRNGGNDGVDCLLQGLNTTVYPSTSDTSDGDGHGTHVSGTIAQATNNGTGVAGVAPEACILPVKVLGDDGSGSDADVAEGIAWAISQGARVINMSLGYPAGYPLEDFQAYPSYSQLDNAPENLTIVVASGNDGALGGVSYPASHPNTIAVGATDVSDSIAPYSNQGPDLDLVAPGGNTSVDDNGDGYNDGVLQETWGDLDPSPGKTNMGFGYFFYQGTSMAAPHVAGAAALLIANDTSLNRSEVLAKLANSAADLGTTGYDETFGYGLIKINQAYSASTTIDTVIEPPEEPTPPSQPTGVSATDNGNGTATIVWSAATGATSYKIKRAKENTRKGTVGDFTVVASQSSSVLSYVDGSGKGTFHYIVTAGNSDGETDSASVSVTVTSSNGGGDDGGSGGGGGGGKCNSKRGC